MLVVMDCSEPLGALTPPQQRSLDLAQSAVAAGPHYPLARSNNPLYTNLVSARPGSGAAAKPKELGVRIKTRQDREREAEREAEGVAMAHPPLPLLSFDAVGDAALWGDGDVPMGPRLPPGYDTSIELD
jgi:hypothetical protein